MNQVNSEYGGPWSPSGCWGASQDPWLISGNIVPMATTCTEGEGLEGVYFAPNSLLTVTDDVGVTSGPDCSPNGINFPIGDTTVTCTASDAAGNVGSVSFTIRVFLQDLSVCSTACFDESGTYVGTTPADTWTVVDDGKVDFDNIQAAVDAGPLSAGNCCSDEGSSHPSLSAMMFEFD